jgi:anti-sigma regulatory factor (Ser/Thr protein kinase)
VREACAREFLGRCQRVTAVCAHAVQLYARETDLVGTVATHLTEGLYGGGAAIAIATGPHRRAFATAIEAAGVDTATLTALDAETMLSRFCTGGRIDRAAFRREIGGLVRAASAGGGPVRAYGEMVALLWDAGEVLAAIELEQLWNDLGRELEFSLLCGYHLDSVAGQDEALEDVCRLHTSVETTAHFGALREAPRAARDFVADALRRGAAGRRLLSDAQLLVAELAANAVLHARSRFSVAVRTGDATVRIAVWDASPLPPVQRDPAPTEASGRGLALVDGLAADWGIEVTDGGKTVWAELPR